MKVQKFNTATNKRELDLVNLADLASEVTHAMGSQLDLPEYTFYVSPDFTQTGQFYNDLEDALDDATTDGNAHTIIVYRGTYTDNYDIANHTVYCFDGVEIRPFNTAFPAIEIDGGALLGNAIVTDNGVTTTAYLIEVTSDAIIQAEQIIADYGAIHINVTGGAGRDIEIRANYISEILDNGSGAVFLDVDAFTLVGIDFDGNADSTYNIKCNEFLDKAIIDEGYCRLEVQNYIKDSTRVIEVAGGSLIASGRLEDYSNSTTASTGSGFPIAHIGGGLQLQNFFAKNALGGIVVGGNLQTLRIANSILEAGSTGGGGADATIDTGTLNDYTVLFNNATSLNSNPSANVIELVSGNKTQSASVTI